MTQEDRQNEQQARSESTHVTDPGHTPGQAEGEDRSLDTGNPPLDPGRTPGQAEGEVELDQTYDSQRTARQDLRSNGQSDKIKETVQERVGKVQERVTSGMQRVNQSMESEQFNQVRSKFQSMADQQGFNTTEIKRWLAMIGGGFFVFHGLRRSLGNLTLAGLGAALFYWGFTGESPVNLLQRKGRTTHRDAEARIRSGETQKSMEVSTTPHQVTKSIIVKARVEDAFNVWANFENFPQFMQHIQSIRKTGDNYSHWVMEGPLGSRIEWDAKTTRMETNKRIAWNSIQGDITTSGQVTFNSLPDNETEVTVTLQYVPPAGMAGEIVAQLFGNPEGKLEEDLRNFKWFVEKQQQTS